MALPELEPELINLKEDKERAEGAGFAEEFKVIQTNGLNCLCVIVYDLVSIDT